MAWTSGFFNSVGGDREYNADQISNIMQGLISNGVYQSVGNKLAVKPNGGMNIVIDTGRGWFADKWAYNDSEYPLTLESSDVLYNRYAAVCVRVNIGDESRTAEPYIKYGVKGTAPEKPTMESTELVQEFCLAYIYIKSGTTEITAADIEDTRFDTRLCGWVTGLITQLDTTTLYRQWESVFYNWFNSLTNYLDEDIEKKLAADMLAVNNRLYKRTATLPKLKWIRKSDGTFSQAIAVEGVTTINHCMILPTADYEDAFFRMECSAEVTATNTITITCLYPEDVEMVLEVIIFNM